MEWSDEGVVLSARAYGETSSIVELLTREHGRHLGLVRGGRSRRMRPVLQAGNVVAARWKARLADHLGSFTLELETAHAARLMEHRGMLAGLQSMALLLRLLPERDPHPNLYEITNFVVGFSDEPEIWPALYVRWELALLDELGVGLDLTSCAATGVTEDLAFVSPKSRRAVSQAAGEPYADKLLRLPVFLRPRTARDERQAASSVDVASGLELTGFFLMRDVLEPGGGTLPPSRTRILA